MKVVKMAGIANATTDAEDCEIEITPEMIEAGAAAFDFVVDFDSAGEGSPDWVVDIYRAMEAARVKAKPLCRR